MKRITFPALMGALCCAWAFFGSFCDNGQTDLASGAPVSGQIGNSGDEVAFKARLAGGHAYRFTLDVTTAEDAGVFSPRLSISRAGGDGATLAKVAQTQAYTLILEYRPADTVDVYVIVGSDKGGFTFTLTMEDLSGGAGDAGGHDASNPRDAGRPQDGGKDAGGHKDASADGAAEDAGSNDDAGADAGTCNCPGGCCDNTGACQNGSAHDRCGNNGGACEDCTANPSKKVCSTGACVACDTVSCAAGCCGGGECRFGNANDQCGTGGNACANCSQQGKACSPGTRDCI